MPSLLHHYFRHLLTGVLLLSFSLSLQAKTEYDIKAAYLYNFIKFVTWPAPDHSDALTVCLFGKDPINDKLMPLNGLQLHGRTVSVMPLHDVDEATNCTVIYLARSEKKYLSQILITTKEHPVLLVSDLEEFAKEGGTIGFVTLGNVIRFDVNLGVARRDKLSISSKLLELANQVIK
ncbi:MAG: YfiR family protein [Oleiphilaceae bacterium]|nr:YfiR family protein [Oleiphilaceae bacterium]